MKKQFAMNKLLLFAILCCCITNSFSQTDSVKVSLALTASSKKEPLLKEGDFIVDLYYGAPNLFTNFVDVGATFGIDLNMNVGVVDYTTKSLGPLGGRIEKMVTPFVGVCGEFNYAYTSVNLKRTYAGNEYNTTIELPRYRVLVGGNFYFLNTNKVNMYVAARLGYLHMELKIPNTDPYIPLKNLSYPIPVPVTGRLAVGFRYFFIPNLGMNLELGGLGGGLINGGICARF